MALDQDIDVQRVNKVVTFENIVLQKGDFIIPVSNNNSKKLNSIIKDLNIQPIQLNGELKNGLNKLQMPKIALIETNFHDMDAGWTRYIFDTYHIPFKILKPEKVKEEKLTEFDVIIFPDNDKTVLLEGKYKGSGDAYNIPALDPKYLKGITKEGVQKLMKFVNEGGIIISWGRSVQLFLGAQSIKISENVKEEFQLPVGDISGSLAKQKLYCPGSLLNISLISDHPLTFGMGKEAKVFSRGRPVFSTSIPNFDTDRRVIAMYPEEKCTGKWIY